MEEIEYTRQLDFYNPAEVNPSVLVVGAGAIGSYVVFALARLGVKNITVLDMDIVEPHNLPNQFFSEIPCSEDEKIYKVNQLEFTLKQLMPDLKLRVLNVKVQDVPFGGEFDYVFPLVDNMETQKYIWEHIRFKHLIGSRVGGHYANIFCVDKEDEYYPTTLHSDADAIQEPCTGRAVVDLSMSIAGICVTAFRQHIKDTIKWKHLFIDYTTGQMYPMVKKEETNADKY